MADSRAWLTQAGSDLNAAKLLRRENQTILYCQVAAKCQQVVEKSVKAIAAQLAELKIVIVPITFDHSIDKYLSSINRMPRSRENSVPDHVRNTLKRHRATIDEIMNLAPLRPPDINRLPKNTEYPFHNEHGTMIAPADAGVFTIGDVDRYMAAAGALFEKSGALIAITARAPR